MTNAKRGRGTRYGVYSGVIAALGLALSACGGASSSGTSAAAASTAPAASTSADSGTSAGGTSAETGTSADTGTSAGDSTSGGTSTSTSSAATGSGSTTSDPSVTAKANTVTIAWTPPTENTNGTPLTNLAGYDIHYGTASGKLTHKISVSNPGIATYVVSNLSAGKYFFAVAAVNSAGTESPLSSQVSANVTN